MQNSTPQKKPLLNYINVFRGLAIIMILLGHTMQLGDPNTHNAIRRSKYNCKMHKL